MQKNVDNLQIALECNWQHISQNLTIGIPWEKLMVI
jgi:hypothetical protein